MRLSHSKLSLILTCPMSYYLNYIQKITLRTQPAALSIGSAVHWGLEHDTDNLEEFWGKNTGYGRDQFLSEAMCHGYLKHKKQILDQILTDTDGSRLELIDEQHELEVLTDLPSIKNPDKPHEFEGIIDWLLLTNKGFIVVDYKTSSDIPDWNKYLDQLYRYIYTLSKLFPGIPVIKIAIVNLRKTRIRQKTNENDQQFLQRLRLEYELNDEDYINYHEYLPESLDKTLLDGYMHNLSIMADMAEMIDKNKLFYINYSNATGQYGKSPYYDIFYHTPGAEVLYKIEDRVWNEDTNTFDEFRDCNKLDLLTIEKTNVLNKYTDFCKTFKEFKGGFEYYSKTIKNFYLVDENLLQTYYKTYLKEKEGLDEGSLQCSDTRSA